MTIENFNDKFPSLKYSENNHTFDGDIYIYSNELIGSCVDKQRLKEAIKKVIGQSHCSNIKCFNEGDDNLICVNELLKELGIK